jgi:hypothetical protein
LRARLSRARRTGAHTGTTSPANPACGYATALAIRTCSCTQRSSDALDQQHLAALEHLDERLHEPLEVGDRHPERSLRACQ